MYKHDFNNSGFFKLDPKEIYSQTDFMDYADEMRKFLKTIENDHLKLDQLITNYTQIEDILLEENLKPESREIYEQQKELLGNLIAHRLGLGYQFAWAIDKIHEEFQKIESAMAKLEKYENHRHRTIGGLYTEKPSY